MHFIPRYRVDAKSTNQSLVVVPHLPAVIPPRLSHLTNPHTSQFAQQHPSERGSFYLRLLCPVFLCLAMLLGLTTYLQIPLSPNPSAPFSYSLPLWPPFLHIQYSLDTVSTLLHIHQALPAIATYLPVFICQIWVKSIGLIAWQSR